MSKVLVDLDDLVGMEDAAKQIGIGIATAWRWVKSGKMVKITIAKRTLIPKSEIERLKLNKPTEK
jgi:predicted site-specific integrase-resolvase